MKLTAYLEKNDRQGSDGRLCWRPSHRGRPGLPLVSTSWLRDKGSALLGNSKSTDDDATPKCQHRFGKKKNKGCRAISTGQYWAFINDAQQPKWASTRCAQCGHAN